MIIIYYCFNNSNLRFAKFYRCICRGICRGICRCSIRCSPPYQSACLRCSHQDF